MESYHDPIRHLKYLRQSLSQDNESIGFFVSAGCPLSVEMPEGHWPLIPDVENLTKHISLELDENTKYKKLLVELNLAGKNEKNIEDILSFLRSLLTVAKGGDVRGLSEKDLDELEKLICECIVKKLNVNLPDKETSYHSLCRWISSIDRKVPVEIFTTNYDLLMEQALEDLSVPYFDGFVGSRRSFFDLKALEDDLIPTHWSRLWKIHGSINWHQETLGTEKKVHRSSEIKEGFSHLIYPSHLKYEESRKMPYLALIDQLNRFIRKKSSLLILSGYSFNDGHLNDTIFNALHANPTAMVLGLMFETFDMEKEGKIVERYPNAYKLARDRHNLNIWTYDKAIIGTNQGPWRIFQSKEDIEYDLYKFVSYVESEGDTNPQIKLGNFACFTDFLKKIIGTPKDEQNA